MAHPTPATPEKTKRTTNRIDGPRGNPRRCSPFTIGFSRKLNKTASVIGINTGFPQYKITRTISKVPSAIKGESLRSKGFIAQLGSFLSHRKTAETLGSL